MTEDKILQLPKRNNYHYNVEHVDNTECMVLYYRLSDYIWNNHVSYCEINGFENKLNQWQIILVDTKDFKLISGWSIHVRLHHLHKNSNILQYCSITIRKTINNKKIQKSICRYLLNPPQDKLVDHINHDTLDNRRCNLRLVTPAENNQNKRGCQSNSKTGIRGVSVTSHNKNTNHEKQYYVAIVHLNKKMVFQKLLPFTPQGLLDAEQAVIEARLKYHTHNEIDRTGVNNG